MIPDRLIVIVVSEPAGMVDLKITIERGGSMRLALGDPSPGQKARVILPRGLLDQREWIADRDGFRPA